MHRHRSYGFTVFYSPFFQVAIYFYLCHFICFLFFSLATLFHSLFTGKCQTFCENWRKKGAKSTDAIERKLMVLDRPSLSANTCSKCICHGCAFTNSVRGSKECSQTTSGMLTSWQIQLLSVKFIHIEGPLHSVMCANHVLTAELSEHSEAERFIQ